MNNEEILAAAQKNKNRGKEYERKVLSRGDAWSSLICLIVGLLLFSIKYFTTNTMDFGLIAVGMCACGVQYLHEGIKLKKTWRIVVGIFQLFFCVIAILAFIGELVLV